MSVSPLLIIVQSINIHAPVISYLKLTHNSRIINDKTNSVHFIPSSPSCRISNSNDYLKKKLTNIHNYYYLYLPFPQDKSFVKNYLL